MTINTIKDGFKFYLGMLAARAVIEATSVTACLILARNHVDIGESMMNHLRTNCPYIYRTCMEYYNN
jgi:hypothetical protein